LHEHVEGHNENASLREKNKKRAHQVYDKKAMADKQHDHKTN
jgi:hypothetical protein